MPGNGMLAVEKETEAGAQAGGVIGVFAASCGHLDLLRIRVVQPAESRALLSDENIGSGSSGEVVVL